MTSIYKEVFGKFDGENMLGEDGSSYAVPGNYASKSKLVEGDTLKAAVQEDGSIIYKQIKTVPRKRFIGTVTDSGKISHDGLEYNVLGAVTRYYKLRPGMQVACISSENASHCAVESVISTKHEDDAVEFVS